MEHAIVALLGEPYRARPMGGEGAFELVAGRGADELAGLGGEQLVDRLRVLLLDRLAGQDHGAAVDILTRKARFPIRLLDESPERGGVDGAVGQKGRQHDGRAPQHLAMHHREAARQPLGLALQQHLGEQEMRGRAADVDADGGEIDVLLVPDILGDLGALVVGEREMLVEQVGVVHRRQSPRWGALWRVCARVSALAAATRRASPRGGAMRRRFLPPCNSSRARFSIITSSVRRVTATSAALTPRTATSFTCSASGTSLGRSALPRAVRKTWIFLRLSGRRSRRI